jgi:hypothetical protein
LFCNALVPFSGSVAEEPTGRISGRTIMEAITTERVIKRSCFILIHGGTPFCDRDGQEWPLLKDLI